MSVTLRRRETHGLRHCVGFRVIGPGGPAGYVEDVRTHGDGTVSALVVESRRPKLVFASDVLRVDEAAEIVIARRLRELVVSRPLVLALT
jgi:hypothetical protein